MRGTGFFGMWVRSALVGPVFFALIYLALLALACWILYQKKKSIKNLCLTGVFAIILFLSFCLPYPALMLQLPLSRWAEDMVKKNAPIYVEPSRRTAIVVLGGGFLPAGIPNNFTLQRIERALEVHRELPNAKIIISDDSIRLYSAEDWLFEYLQRREMPLSQILFEVAAGNTRGNVCNVQALIAEENFQQIILVTSLSHIPRAFLTAKKCGMPAKIAAPERVLPDLSFCPTWYSLLYFSQMLNEYAGIAGYKLAGWI